MGGGGVVWFGAVGGSVGGSTVARFG